MRRLLMLALILGISGAGLTLLGDNANAAPGAWTITVPAHQTEGWWTDYFDADDGYVGYWTDTGIDVAAGDVVTVTADPGGRWTHHPTFPPYGAEGFLPATPASKCWPGFDPGETEQSTFGGQLVGRIVDPTALLGPYIDGVHVSGDPEFRDDCWNVVDYEPHFDAIGIGLEHQFVVAESGRLQFTINDDAGQTGYDSPFDRYSDNSGYQTLTVKVTTPPTPRECDGAVPGEWHVVPEALTSERAGIDPFFLPGGPGPEDDVVIAAGGYDTNNHNAHLDNVDVYDVLAYSWDVGPSLPEPRGHYESVVLDDHRAILIGGTSGIPGDDFLYASTVVYNLQDNSWVRGPDLRDSSGVSQVADRHSAMRAERLSSGDVIVTGGVTPHTNPTGTTDTYIIKVDSDTSVAPSTWDVEKVAPMATRRQSHTMAVFSDSSGNEKVLVAGGFEEVWVILDSAEVYDVATKTWESAGSMSNGRYWGEMAVGGDGRPVVFGGEQISGGSLASTDVFEISGTPWPAVAVGNMVQPVRWHDSITLESGHVLSVAGHASGMDLKAVQLYDPLSQSWSAWPDMHFARRLQTSGGAVELPGGSVLVAGGVFGSNGQPTTELFVPCVDPNSPPSLTVENDVVTVEEGDTAVNSGSFVDADLDDEVTVAASIGSIAQTAGNAGTWTWSLDTSDGPGDSGQVTITATDQSGESATPVIFDLGVDNVRPAALTFVCPPDPIETEGTITCEGSFADPGADTHTAELHWSDGVVTSGTVVGRSVTGNRSFLTPDVLSVDLIVTDDDGDSSDPLRHQFVVVYDPAAGFATGGGWFVPGNPGDSDLDDLMPNLDGSSKASFGFVVKYQNGQSTVPNGNLEFQYRAGGVNLKSAGYEWLVLTNSNWAKFEGTASIKGLEGEFPFRVDARDGINQPDRFVIRIWDPGSDPDLDDHLYKASGDLGGGQIKIHRR